MKTGSSSGIKRSDYQYVIKKKQMLEIFEKAGMISPYLEIL